MEKVMTKLIVDAVLQIASYAVTVLCWWIAAHYGSQIILAWWSGPAKEQRRPEAHNVHEIRKAS
jgi:hypothetical protein